MAIDKKINPEDNPIVDKFASSPISIDIDGEPLPEGVEMLEDGGAVIGLTDDAASNA